MFERIFPKTHYFFFFFSNTRPVRNQPSMTNNLASGRGSEMCHLPDKKSMSETIRRALAIDVGRARRLEPRTRAHARMTPPGPLLVLSRGLNAFGWNETPTAWCPAGARDRRRGPGGRLITFVDRGRNQKRRGRRARARHPPRPCFSAWYVIGRPRRRRVVSRAAPSRPPAARGTVHRGPSALSTTVTRGVYARQRRNERARVHV